jgi:hypothetical protein
MSRLLALLSRLFPPVRQDWCCLLGSWLSRAEMVEACRQRG